jgi:hypothetical protein
LSYWFQDQMRAAMPRLLQQMQNPGVQVGNF